MFLDLKNALKVARDKGFAIGAFNVFDLEGAKAVASAAEELNAPLIFQTTPKAIEYAGLEQIFSIVKNEIHTRNLKATIHLDHAKDFGLVKKCIEIGYNSVMIDGSDLDFDANIHLTKKTVNYAKEYNVNVEAELGAIGKEAGENGANFKGTTDQSLVKEFIELTKIDALGISVGNAHGAPKGEKINFELLEKISNKTNIPLVLHGSSGLRESEIKKAIKCGVAKFNIDTNLRKAFIKELKDQENNNDPRDILSKIMSAQEEIVKKYIEFFGTKGKYEEV